MIAKEELNVDKAKKKVTSFTLFLYKKYSYSRLTIIVQGRLQLSLYINTGVKTLKIILQHNPV